MSLKDQVAKYKQIMIGKVAEKMVVTIDEAPSIAPKFVKDLSTAKVAFLTTAGVHLKSQPPFNVKGDASFRIIPKDIEEMNLMITHDHYDKDSALKDMNCVFPLAHLRDFEKEGIIGSVGPRQIGLMGYIPQLKTLMNKTAVEIADIFEEDCVDIVLLSPG